MPKQKTKDDKPVRKVIAMTIGTALLTGLSQLAIYSLLPENNQELSITLGISALLSAAINFQIGYYTRPVKRDGVEDAPRG